jgi:hypothetical protein
MAIRNQGPSTNPCGSQLTASFSKPTGHGTSSSSYDKFKDEYLPEYEGFLRRDKGPERAEQFHRLLDYDLSRVFKCSRQMTEIRADTKKR